MSKHKYTNIVCIAVVAVMLALTVAFLYSPNWGMTVAHAQPAYASRLFSTDTVHTIDIQVKDADWQGMLDNARAEEYIAATVVIDGEKVGGVGLRPKGNSSLSMVASSDSDRYSLKIEFDHFSSGISYYGLDKLALNNIVQDSTYMKDYITYQMMNEMGADAPLSSFIWVTVNGEDWGLYLAVEGVEEAFAKRVYGSNFGEIYKPDTMDMNDVANFQRDDTRGGGFAGFGGEMPDMPDMENLQGFEGTPGEMPDFANMPEITWDGNGAAARGGGRGGFGGFGGGATSLLYTDDDPDSYSAIFDNAVFNASDADKKRLIQSLKQLNEGENLDAVLDVDEVIRYFVVHNFVLNSDSYTGNMTHNYYLAENDGRLSMIAWDYNLAFGGMGGMGRMPGNENAGQTAADPETTIDQATTLVNYPIDSPLLSGSIEDKPMISWIFSDEAYLEKYHAVYAEYVAYFTSGGFAEMYDNAIALISPFVEKDPTAFCTYDEFLTGSSTLREFCLLRAESIRSQLDGAIASTSEEQTETSNANFIDASHIDIESMGSSGMGFGRDRADQFAGFRNSETEQLSTGDAAIAPQDGAMPQRAMTAEFSQENIDAAIDGSGAAAGTAPADDAGRNAGNAAGRAFPDMGTRSTGTNGTTAFSQSTLILLAACAIVLIGGILFAWKRR